MVNFREEMDTTMPLQRRIWGMERIGWFVLVAFIAAAAFGLFGKGALSQASISNPNGSLILNYDRFARVNSVEKLFFVLKCSKNNQKSSIFIGNRYFKDTRILEILPTPDKVDVNVDYYEFQFNTNIHDSVFRVVFMVMPQNPGTQVMNVGTSKNETVTFNQYIYP